MYLEVHVTFIYVKNIIIVRVTVIDELGSFCCCGIDKFYLFSGEINGGNNLDGFDGTVIVKFCAYSFFVTVDEFIM